MNLRDLDLNLLVLLDVLLTRRSVTNAAADLGMSQPAMSHALGRLRETFGDQLLVRSGREMVTTARADELDRPLRELLSNVQSLMHPQQTFIPAESERIFQVVTNGFAGYAFLPSLMTALAAHAPGCDLRVGALTGRDVRPAVADGTNDLGLITGEAHQVPESLFYQELYADPFTCVVRRGHPILEGRFTTGMYAKMRHVLVSPKGDPVGVVDDVLREQGYRRRLGLVVPNFVAVTDVIVNTDLIVTVPTSVASAFAGRGDTVRIKPPLRLPVGMFGAIWHERNHFDPGHRWFRELVGAAAARFAEAHLDGEELSLER